MILRICPESCGGIGRGVGKYLIEASAMQQIAIDLRIGVLLDNGGGLVCSAVFYLSR